MFSADITLSISIRLWPEPPYEGMDVSKRIPTMSSECVSCELKLPLNPETDPIPTNVAPQVSFVGPQRPPLSRPPRFPRSSPIPVAESPPTVQDAPLVQIPVEPPLEFSVSCPSASSSDAASSNPGNSGLSAVTETAPLMAGDIAKCLIPTPRFILDEWAWSIPPRRPNPCTPSATSERFN